MTINYSFIVPHRNSPDLLNRCLSSIPEREDVQIIVVDDNSDASLKPVITRKDVMVIMIDEKQSRGAGKARNIGFAQASGKWCLFADADDYYVQGFLDVLDQYVNSDSDVVYFDAKCVYSDTLLPAKKIKKLNDIISSYDNSAESEDSIKYKVHVPWNKMVNNDFLKKRRICFEEVLSGNDAMFSLFVGYFAKKIQVELSQLYVYTITSNSITTKQRNAEMLVCALQNYYKQRSFLRFVNRREWTSNIQKYLLGAYKRRGLFDVFLLTLTLLFHYSEIRKQRNKYVELVKTS